MADKQKKCKHPSCLCMAKEGSDYCGTFCEGEAQEADITCGCGHPACSSLATVTT